VRCAIDEAFRCKREGKGETILFNMSGHGHFDMGAYISYFEGKLVDQDYDQKELAMALAGLPAVAGLRQAREGHIGGIMIEPIQRRRPHSDVFGAFAGARTSSTTSSI